MSEDTKRKKIEFIYEIEEWFLNNNPECSIQYKGVECVLEEMFGFEEIMCCLQL